MEVEKDQINQTRMICSIHPDNFTWVLESGETFTIPERMMDGLVSVTMIIPDLEIGIRMKKSLGVV